MRGYGSTVKLETLCGCSRLIDLGDKDFIPRMVDGARFPDLINVPIPSAFGIQQRTFLLHRPEDGRLVYREVAF